MNFIESYIRDVANFPKEGVVFKDITPLLASAEAIQKTLDIISTPLLNQNIDKVVGMESRGFLFGILLAQRLNAGFVPVRKPGKLPFETISESYALEYGTDTLEIHADAIKKDERVVIHDDVLATGGTASATCKLVEKLGGEIVQLNFLMELEFLQGRERLKNYSIFSALKY